MSEFDKLDNLDNMSDEEFDAFIKGELKSSLQEDIKIDDELVCKTVQAIHNAENEEKLKWITNDELQSNEKNETRNNKVISIKKYIPILSMVACACFIVMAGSLIYTKVGRKTGYDATVSNNKKQEATKNEYFSQNNIVYEEPESDNQESDIPLYDTEDYEDGTDNIQNSIQDSIFENEDVEIDSNWSDTQVDKAPESSLENDTKEEIDNLPDKNMFRIIFEIISSIFSKKDI